MTERNEKCPCGSGKKFKKCCGSHVIGKHTAKVINADTDLIDKEKEQSILGLIRGDKPKETENMTDLANRITGKIDNPLDSNRNDIGNDDKRK